MQTKAEQLPYDILRPAKKDVKKQKYYQAKRNKRKVPLMYFTEDTERAIIEYNAEPDEIRRNILYNTKIYPVFDKLAEITIHANKLYHFDTTYEDMKVETVTFLTRQISKFDPNNGKAFSFFSVIAKRFLLAENRKNYKRSSKNVELELDANDVSNVFNYEIAESNRDLNEFFELFIEFLDCNSESLFDKHKELSIAHAVIEVFRIRHNIENYNKKSIYILIREQTNAKTQLITKVIQDIELIYRRLFDVYSKYGTLEVTELPDETDDFA